MRGTLRDPHGRPIDEAELSWDSFWRPGEARPDPELRAYRTHRGRERLRGSEFVIPEVLTGDLVVEVSTPDGRRGRVKLDIDDEREKSVVIELHEAGARSN